MKEVTAFEEYRDLESNLGMAIRDGETELDYVKRMAQKANKISDDEWADLEESTQVWVNTVLQAIERQLSGEAAPILMPDGTPFPGQAVEAQNEEQETEETTEVTTKAKAKNGSTKPKTATRGRPRGSVGYPPDAKITVLNPDAKRKGSKAAKKFAKYQTGMTVEEARTKGFGKLDFDWDTKHGFISIG